MDQQEDTGDTTPRITEVDAVFWHVNDIDWTEVQRQQNADGSVSVVREKWPIIRPGFLSAHVHYEPGMIVRRHGHRSNHVVFVLGGGGWIGGDWSAPGTHIHVPLGAAFGPIVAGPEGLTCWELSFGEFGGWGDQPELYEQEIAARGVSPLPDPPLDIGDWFVDPRGDWGGERPSPKVDGLVSVVSHVGDSGSTGGAGEPDDGGSIAAVREQLPIDRTDFTSAYVEVEPGAVIETRNHRGHRVVWIIEGGAWCGDRWCPAGTHVELADGVPFGPIAAGDDGVVFLELTDGGR
jgi:quercetin dioxygenase-like cupin family protein